MKINEKEINKMTDKSKGQTMNNSGFTQVPDFLIDSAASFSLPEFATIVFIARKTMGWGKRTDGISMSQFVKQLPMSEMTIRRAIKGLESKGIISIDHRKQANGGDSFNFYGFTDAIIKQANTRLDPSLNVIPPLPKCDTPPLSDLGPPSITIRDTINTTTINTTTEKIKESVSYANTKESQQADFHTHQQAADSSRPQKIETSNLVSQTDDIFDCEWFAGSADAEASSKGQVTDSSHTPLASQETDQVAKKAAKNTAKTDKKASPRRFVPPTYAEVAAYCLERNNGINAEHFVDFYESKGWMVGANKMVSWQSAVRTWEQKRKDGGLAPASRPVKQHGEIWFSQDCKTKEEFEQRASDQADRVLAMMEQFGFSN